MLRFRFTHAGRFEQMINRREAQPFSNRTNERLAPVGSHCVAATAPYAKVIDLKGTLALVDSGKTKDPCYI